MLRCRPRYQNVFEHMVKHVYPGHEEGAEESSALVEYLKDLNQKNYTVLQKEFINQKNHPPYILAVEKKIDDDLS